MNACSATTRAGKPCRFPPRRDTTLCNRVRAPQPGLRAACRMPRAFFP